MPELTPEQIAKLDALIERGFAEDHAGALSYAISQAEGLTRDIEESPEDIRKIMEGIAELDRGEGIPVEDIQAFTSGIWKEALARAEQAAHAQV